MQRELDEAAMPALLFSCLATLLVLPVGICQPQADLLPQLSDDQRALLYGSPGNFVRVADASKTSFTEEEKARLLQLHNAYRSMVQPPASNMRELVWDDDLEEFARQHGQACTGAHSHRSMVKVWSVLVSERWDLMAENLYWSYGDRYSIEEALWLFWEEGADYDIYNNTCVHWRTCGHYKALVLESSWRMGCSINQCQTFSNNPYPGPAMFMTCNYNGMYLDAARPYTVGETCSGCNRETVGSQFANCRNRLCVTSQLLRRNLGFDGNTTLIGLDYSDFSTDGDSELNTRAVSTITARTTSVDPEMSSTEARSSSTGGGNPSQTTGSSSYSVTTTSPKLLPTKDAFSVSTTQSFTSDSDSRSTSTAASVSTKSRVTSTAASTETSTTVTATSNTEFQTSSTEITKHPEMTDSSTSSYSTTTDASTSSYSTTADASTSSYSTTTDASTFSYSTTTDASTSFYSTTTDASTSSYSTTTDASTSSYSTTTDASTSSYSTTTDASTSSYSTTTDSSTSSYSTTTDASTPSYSTTTSPTTVETTEETTSSTSSTQTSTPDGSTAMGSLTRSDMIDTSTTSVTIEKPSTTESASRTPSTTVASSTSTTDVSESTTVEPSTLAATLPDYPSTTLYSILVRNLTTQPGGVFPGTGPIDGSLNKAQQHARSSAHVLIVLIAMHFFVSP